LNNTPPNSKNRASGPDKLLRLNRALALCGLASRRKADELIASGLVRVNGKAVLDFNFLVDPDCDKLELEGRQVDFKVYDYVALNKPTRVITSCSDENGRLTVLDLLPPELRHLKPVGRLDYDSAGLLLLTNDGELARDLTHPSHGVGKTYMVTVLGDVEDFALEKMVEGVDLSEGRTRSCYIERVFTASAQNQGRSRFLMTIQEGKNRQIRRMFQAYGYEVIALVRVAIGELQLGQLKSGCWRRLSLQEVALLKTANFKAGS
jgi:23S rRNA pseudouridine2605 synthase